MPYARPPLTELIDQVIEDINTARIMDAQGNVLIALLQKAILRPVAYATAGIGYEHYGYLDWIALQSNPSTATDEYLEAWAGLKGVTRKQATATQGTITLPGSLPATVPAGTAVSRNDGASYVVTADTVFTGTSAAVPIQATVAGAAGNFDANTVFVLADPVANVAPQSTASAQTVPGADVELDDSLRTRMLEVYAAPPQGGDRQDYISWALAVPGVTRAWIAPNGMGPGTVVVYVMLDVSEAANGGFPQGTNGVAANEPRDTAATGDQLVVADALFPLRPVTALVYVCAPTPSPVNFTITDLGTANTTANQAAITAALTDMFVRLGNVGGSVDPQTGAAWPAIEPSDWYAAIEAIAGVGRFKVPVPAAALTPGAGQLLTAGTITFSS